MAAQLNRGVIEQGYTYDQFRKITKDLYEQGKPTSSVHAHEVPVLDFTKLNIQRMNRLEKTVEIDDQVQTMLQNLPEEWYWVTFAEGWCGDVAQNLPVIAKMAELSPKIELRILFRDEHPELMDQYLTDGGRSIPKLVCLRKSDLMELGTWGPRPRPVQSKIRESKENKDPNQSKHDWVEEIHEMMHEWYAKDQGRSIQEEFLYFIKQWKKKSRSLASV